MGQELHLDSMDVSFIRDSSCIATWELGHVIPYDAMA